MVEKWESFTLEIKQKNQELQSMEFFFNLLFSFSIFFELEETIFRNFKISRTCIINVELAKVHGNWNQKMFQKSSYQVVLMFFFVVKFALGGGMPNDMVKAISWGNLRKFTTFQIKNLWVCQDFRKI